MKVIVETCIRIVFIASAFGLFALGLGEWRLWR